MPTDPRYALEQLAEVASVPERQIRELVRLDILPAPSSRGRGATYGTEHLDRLRAWKALRGKLPPKTTNEQIRIILDKLSEGGILRPIAEGTIPFEVVDDGKEEVTIAEARSVAMAARLSRELAVASPNVSHGERKNEAALEYLSSMRKTGRVTLPRTTGEPRVEVGVGDQTGAGLSLRRMYEALRQHVAQHAAEVRVRPPKTEMWHRVRSGNDFEISARGPLAPDEIALLETVGQLLQQAIYRKEK